MNKENHNSEREELAARLKQARVSAGLSQDNAAKILDIPRPAISEIESGKRKVSAEEIIKFSKVYRVSTSWLLLMENETELNEQIKIAARELSKMSEANRKKLLEILKILPE